jgi:hypothetical protein
MTDGCPRQARPAARKHGARLVGVVMLANVVGMALAGCDDVYQQPACTFATYFFGARLTLDGYDQARAEHIARFHICIDGVGCSSMDIGGTEADPRFGCRVDASLSAPPVDCYIDDVGALQVAIALPDIERRTHTRAYQVELEQAGLTTKSTGSITFELRDAHSGACITSEPWDPHVGGCKNWQVVGQLRLDEATLDQVEPAWQGTDRRCPEVTEEATHQAEQKVAPTCLRRRTRRSFEPG